MLAPAYADSVNHFWYYTFDDPVVLPAGTFYAGTLQPLGGISDSLYFGLDVNRIGTNHTFFNVTGKWEPSRISGAVMMRPLLGRTVSGSYVDNVSANKRAWDVYPNPAHNTIHFRLNTTEPAEYHITDIQGHLLLSGSIANGTEVDISELSPGMYFVAIVSDGIPSSTQKIIKL